MIGRIARISTSFIDVPDLVSVAVYFAGCSIRCKGCHNPDLWNPKSGEDVDLDDVIAKIKANPLAESVVFMGGEPTDQMDFLIALAKKLTTFNRAIYTGREFEDLPKELIDNLDNIYCGPYRQDLPSTGRLASANQREFRKENGLWICHTA